MNFDFHQISYVLAALQASARGTQACINAASTVSGIIADLVRIFILNFVDNFLFFYLFTQDTTILFATAGTLNSEHDDETFADHREAILKTAKALVEDTKTLVAGAASSQEQLASAAQAAVRTITKVIFVFSKNRKHSTEVETKMNNYTMVIKYAKRTALLLDECQNYRPIIV